ncbi:MAG: hypothetical protein AAFN92_19560, partial [Bacteroidota bacterium]
LLNQGTSLTFGRFVAGLDLRYQSASFIDFANEHEIAGFFTVDARLRWEKDALTLSAHGFNLTDRTYATNGQLDAFGRPTFHGRAGVNGWLELTYRF